MEMNQFWSDLSIETKNFLSQKAQVLEYKRGDGIYSQGDLPKGLYFLEDGLVSLMFIGENSGKEHLVRFFKKGQFFGHRSLFSDEKHHANAIVLEKTKIKFLRKDIIFHVLESNPLLFKKIVAVLAKELRRCELNQLRILENQILPRIAQAIIYLKDIKPDYNWTRQEIANFAASTTSTVIKAMNELESMGFILQEGRRVTILNREGLLNLQDDL